MTAELLIAEIQKLIDRGTISPSAEIGIRANEIEIDLNAIDLSEIKTDLEFDDVEIGAYESSFNKLILLAKSNCEMGA